MRRFPAFFILLILILSLGGCEPDSRVPPTSESGPSQTQQPNPLPTGIATDQAGTPVTITNIYFWDAMNGWGIGTVVDDPFQHVLRTADQGNTWVDVTPAGAVADPQTPNTAAISAFVDGNHAWVTYYNPIPAPPLQEYLVWYTADGGQNWQASQTLQMPETLDFFMPANLGFSDPANGWLLAHLGAGMSHDYVALYKTADGGQNWDLVVDPSQAGVIQSSLPMTCAKNGVTFLDASTGWVTGGCNGVLPGLFFYQTTDGGKTWLPATLPPPQNAPNIMMSGEIVCDTRRPTAESGLVTVQVSCQVSTGDSQAWLYRSESNGQDWQIEMLPAPFGLVEITEGGPMWMLGRENTQDDTRRTLFRSNDEGITWAEVLGDLNWQGLLNFVDARHGFGLVTTGDTPHLIKTDDGGETWVQVEPLVKPES